MCLDSSFTLFRPIEKSVIRIRQSSIAGQPNAAGFNKCPPGRPGVQDGTYKGKSGMGDCGRTSRPQTPILLSPQPPREIIAREAEYRRDRQCPESGHLT